MLSNKVLFPSWGIGNDDDDDEDNQIASLLIASHWVMLGLDNLIM